MDQWFQPPCLEFAEDDESGEEEADEQSFFEFESLLVFACGCDEAEEQHKDTEEDIGVMCEVDDGSEAGDVCGSQPCGDEFSGFTGGLQIIELFEEDGGNDECGDEAGGG